MAALFDSLQDALLIVSATGKTLYANPAALSVLPAPRGEQLSAEWLQSQIEAIRRGHLRPPLTFDIELARQSAPADLMRVTLLQSPAGGNLIVVMKNITTGRLHENMIGNLAEMLLSEFSAPMTQFLSALSDMQKEFERHAKGNWPLQSVVADVSRKGTSLEKLLKNITVLASTYKWEPMRSDDRILVTALVDDALHASKALLAERQIRVRFCGLDDRLPVIYGSRLFLAQALAGYLTHLIERIGRGVNILISAKAAGNVIFLTIANYGEIIPEKSSSVLLSLAGTGQPKPPKAMNLTLALCKRVVELNGGTLRFGRENDKISSITFELPVGAPAKAIGESCNECSILSQAMLYARDFAEVMVQSKEVRTLLKKSC